MEFIFRNVFTSSLISKDLVTDRNWSLDAGFKQFCAVEFHVQHIEVETSIDSSQVRDTFDEMMSKFVSMTLKKSIYSTCWQ